MKRLFVWVLLLCMLCGCSSITPAAETAAAELWTEEELLEAFEENAREGAQALDCVVMEQTAYDIAGVVQYTLSGDNVCRFDFVKTDGTVFRMGMEFTMDEMGTLAFVAADSISCRMLRTDGSAYIGTIIYYEDAETGEIGFRVSEENVPLPEETFFRESSADHQDPRWTEHELLTAFYQYAEEGTVIVDCIVLEESACDIVGVVQYTQVGEDGCWFDFIDSAGFPRSAGIEEGGVIEDTLVCVGADTVQCRLLDASGEEYICEAAYFEEPDDITTGFKIVSR